MKKTYQRPAITRRENISKVTAGPIPSDFVETLPPIEEPVED
jgi:hypothetical protein